MPDENQDRPRISGFWIFILIVGAIVILGDLNRRMVDTRRLERDAEILETEVVVRKTENAILQTQVAGATSEALVRAWAHEHAGMVQDGEVLVVPVSPGEGTLTSIATPTPAPPPPSNWEVWLSLLFGG
jgi:cell division protein FtsB